MKLGHVVLYVENSEEDSRFWQTNFDFTIDQTHEVGEFKVYDMKVKDQDVHIQLVPKKMMENNPYNLDLATPSILFYEKDFEALYTRLQENGVQVSEMMEVEGRANFAFFDPNGNPFAVQPE